MTFCPICKNQTDNLEFFIEEEFCRNQICATCLRKFVNEMPDGDYMGDDEYMEMVRGWVQNELAQYSNIMHETNKTEVQAFKEIMRNKQARYSDAKTSNSIVKIDKTALQTFLESMKNRMGIGTPEQNTTDTYERGMNIVPDIITPNENEIPVKQYNIAVLRNLLRFERAEGRIQVTNKRVIFRAAGRSVGGRTTTQQEFNVDEIAGLEAKRGYRFSGFHFIWGFLNFMFASLASISLILNITVSGLSFSESVGILLLGYIRIFLRNGINTSGVTMFSGFLVWLVGMILFFTVKRQFLHKLLFLGFGNGGFLVFALSIWGF